MSVTLLTPDGEKARHKMIREIVEELIRVYPKEMREVARYLKEQTSQQLDPKTGRWRNETDCGGYFKVSFPQIFMDVLRPIMRELLPEEPPFAHDDSDLIYLMRVFPDLMGGKNIAERLPQKKDYRKRELIYSDKRQI